MGHGYSHPFPVAATDGRNRSALWADRGHLLSDEDDLSADHRCLGQAIAIRSFGSVAWGLHVIPAHSAYKCQNMLF